MNTQQRKTGNMRKIIGVLACALALAFTASASAQSTVSIPGFNCSVTAYNASVGGYGVGAQAKGGVSCGGAQYNYSKTIDVYLDNLVASGWTHAGSSGWEPWSATNPDVWAYGFSPCVFMRWYASDVVAEVQHNGTESGAEVNSHNAGWQCL